MASTKHNTLFRSDRYDDFVDCPLLTTDIMTGAELLAMYDEHTDDDRFVRYERVAFDSELDPNTKYQVTYILEDITELSSWYIEIEIKEVE